jgi:hypothetical protein
LLDIQAELGTIETLLRDFATKRSRIHRDPRSQQNSELMKLASADARDINEALNRIDGARGRLGAARDALETYYRQGGQAAERQERA